MSAVILLTLLGAVSAVPRLSDRIFGGVDTHIEKYPFMANLQLDLLESYWRSTCGGSIITTRTILSAAHCFVDDNEPARWRVRVGSSYNDEGQVHTIQRFIIHEAYDNHNNDVAIVRLNAPVTLSATVATISIAGRNYHLADGTPVTTMGWGRLVWGGLFTHQLREVETNIINQEVCWERYEFLRNIPMYSYYPEVTSSMICSGVLEGAGRGACTGDTGSPVIHNIGDGTVVQIGIVSWAFGCSDVWYPWVNIRVSSFVNWIVTNGSW